MTFPSETNNSTWLYDTSFRLGQRAARRHAAQGEVCYIGDASGPYGAGYNSVVKEVHAEADRQRHAAWERTQEQLRHYLKSGVAS